MIADREDFGRMVDAKHQARRAEIMPMARLLAGASPIMAELMVDERWTRYQQALQGLVDRWKLQRDSAKDKLGSSGLADAELRKLNTDVLTANATITAFELAIQLPAEIAKGGSEAAAMVKEYEKKNAAADEAKP